MKQPRHDAAAVLRPKPEPIGSGFLVQESYGQRSHEKPHKVGK